jgi:hypothetical protein
LITPTMHYGKIAGGRLDHEMQLAFLEAQTMGEHHGVGTTVTLEIKIVPKLPNEEFGAIQYSIGVKRQGKKSKSLLHPDQRRRLHRLRLWSEPGAIGGHAFPWPPASPDVRGRRIPGTDQGPQPHLVQ